MRKDQIINAAKFLFFLSLGIGVFLYVYRGQDFGKILEAVEHLNWFWVFVSIFISLTSHVSRAVRWQILIKSLNYTPKLHNTIFAVFIMYLANLALPRMGEVTRCGVVKRYEGISFTQLLGTVFLERLVDMIMLLVLTLIVIFTQTDVLLNFLKSNPEVQSQAEAVFTSSNLAIIFGVGIAGLIGTIVFARTNKSELLILVKLREFIGKFSDGIKTIYRMKQKGWFILHSLYIWVIYFLMLYLAFFAFDFTSHLPLSAGLVVFVLASYGMVAPVNGGIGAWHFMAIQALLLYGIGNVDAAAFALIVHSAMTLSLMGAGALSVILLPVFNTKRNEALVSSE